MKIGDVDLPCVSSFDVADAKRKTETIAPLGTDLHAIAEFDPDPVQLEIAGTLFQEFSGSKTADDYADDLTALASRKSVWNYVHNVQGKYGFVSAESCNVDPRENTRARRDFTLQGTFLPLAEYWGRIDSNPVLRTNTFTGISMEDCVSWLTIPKGSHYATAGDLRTVDSEYGTLTQSNGTYINYMPTAAQDGIGEVRAFDGTKRIYSKAHLISGVLTISNGLYSVEIDASTDTIKISYWDGEQYSEIDTFTVSAFTHMYMEVCRPDYVEVHLSTGDSVTLEAGRPPMLDVDTLTCSSLTPGDATTDTDNYLTLGSDLYVASDQALGITSSVISGSGKKWIFHAASSVAQEAKNCLVDSRAIAHVTRRW